MLHFLNIFFTITHLTLITFILSGWIWPKTRKAHLITLAVTAGSWIILGIWYGWGYCPLTDWHWDVKENLGEKNLPSSFIKYMADKITGSDINHVLIDWVTVGGLVFGAMASMYVKWKKPHS